MEYLIYLILCVACSITWRMGGAAGYDKLWRRIGSSVCIFLPIILCHNPLMYAHLFALAMIVWGSWSYFGWITPGVIEEKWFNFFAAALLTQCAPLVLWFSWKGLVIAIGFALLGALGKTFIDFMRMNSRDVVSELFYGFIMCLGVTVTSLIN